MAHPFLERLKQGPILCDGAMGTLVFQRGGTVDQCFDHLNLTNPTLIQEIHRDYLAAGAEVIETNTFGANRFKLEKHSLTDKVAEINRRGAKNGEYAVEVSGRPAFVAGSIGPTGRTLAPIGLLQPDLVREAYRDQINGLLAGGVDLLMIETIGSLAEMEQAVWAARDLCDLPIVAQMTFSNDGRTVGGQTVREVARRLVELEVDVIGVNCSVGPRGVLRVLRELRQLVPDEIPLSVQPNAGWPTQVDDRVIYPMSDDYMARFVKDALAAGATLIGGCCGTTPEHVAAMRVAMDEVIGAGSTRRLSLVPEQETRQELKAADEPTEFARKLGKQFLVSVELDPPRGLNPEKMLTGAQMLKEAGVDAVNVADSPMARVRMSALALCYMVQDRIGLETILHFTTRDRNLMGLQSDLIGAHAMGVRNVLALTGDPPSLGDYPDLTPVYDVDSVGLVRVLKAMNAGTDAAGASIGQQASFTIAVACDPTRDDLPHEADRLYRKLEAGGELIMTQPIYEMETWNEFVKVYEDKYGPIGVPILLGILPLYSHRHAEFLYNEVPGIRPSEEIRDRMRRAGNEARKEGVKIAQELLLEARDQVHGVYIMPSFGRYSMAVEVLEALKSRELTAALPGVTA
ncbi:MAG TPA: bifunctional homocysteine S-methyltransferase/methylenetetrahydrofolate reductase [Thermomicrobiales bacterium]|nr:bifunctional homocysteine S-methyltransferase/methylenetetrahydrofolate reductase [Thermomicrobiales bacterium]